MVRATSWSWVPALAIVACRPEAIERSPDPARGPAEAEAPDAPEPPVAAGHAVLRTGGSLYTSASSTTPIVLPELGPRKTAAPGVTIDIVGEENGRLVVETLGGAAGRHHCAGELSGLSGLRLRLYVDPKDLMQITTVPVEHGFADGTKIALSAGVPIEEAGGSDPLIQRAHAAGTLVDVPVPKTSRGTFHQPAEARAKDGALGRIHDGGDPPSPLRYGDGGTLAEHRLFRQGGTLAHYGVTSKDGVAFLTVRNACLEAIVRTSTSRITASYGDASQGGAFVAAGDDDVWAGLTGAEVGAAFGGGPGLVGGPVYTARVGAPIHWKDGALAGQVLSARHFDGSSREVDGRRCFEVEMVFGKGAALPLCFAPGDLEEKTTPEARGTTEVGTVGLIAPGGASSRGGLGTGGTPVAAVRVGKAAVEGSLEQSVIRGIVRAQISAVRDCYDQLLTRNPKAEGRVTVSFTIAGDGTVTSATASSNTTGDTVLGSCIAKAVEHWKFPKPTDGGDVTVSFPFVLSPGA